jgi:two-component system phosphate regulon response regulator PhoB
LTPKRILVVDEAEDLLELIRYNLEREGYRVKCLRSGEDAAREARQGQPDLVLLDRLLPDVDGLEVCKTLKSDSTTKHIPVIIMFTALGERAEMGAELQFGPDNSLKKPFPPRILLARVRAALRQHVQGDPNALEIGDLNIHPGGRNFRKPLI